MTRGRALLIVGAGLVLSAALLLTRAKPTKPASVLTPPSTSQELPPESGLPAPSSVAVPTSVPAEARAVTATPTQPQCQRDSDCLGPHSPACVRAHCVAQRCVYDERSCACQANEQCDDGDPCTRDLCFSRTNACIHVEEGCTPADRAP